MIDMMLVKKAYFFSILTPKEKNYTQIDSNNNRWQRRLCTLSVQMYFYVTGVNSVFVSDKIINNSNIIETKVVILVLQ